MIIEPPERIKEHPEAAVYFTLADENIRKEARTYVEQLLGGRILNELSYNSLILYAFNTSPVINDYLSSIHPCRHKSPAILFDCYNGLILGGVETWTISLCSSLIQNGFDNVYIISDNGAYDIPTILSSHVIATKIDHNHRFSVETVIDIIRIIAENLPCKIITSTTNEIMLAACLAKKAFGADVGIFSVVHNSNDEAYNNYYDFKEYLDQYVAVSKYIYNQLIQQGVMKKNLYYMTLPFPCTEILSRQYSCNPLFPLRIGYAGRLDGMEGSQKRLDLLLLVAQELLKRNVNYIMSFAGDGKARDRVQAYINEFSLADNVQLLGTLDRYSELPKFWRTQDICISMSDYEGRCLSIVEAMGNGAVPVVTDVSGVQDDIVNGINGYIVPLGDYQLAANRIEHLYQNRNKLREMGQRAHDEVYPKSLMRPHMDFWVQILRINE